MRVLQIPPEVAYPWLLNVHYAKRLCPISYAFGLYDDADLVGVCTYGVPASAPLREGVCGEQFQNIVLELNRLVCKQEKNYASMLVGRSLQMLPRPSVVVSYADISMGHVGYVYQATNWLYCGLSAKRTDWKLKGLEHLHGATIADMSRGQENRAEYMREKYGDDFYLQDRPRKHRYIYFVGSKSQIKVMRAALNYQIENYPKGNTCRYDVGKTESQMLLI